MKTLQDKWVLVTGAGSGIGLECAREFARRGAKLVVSDVNVAAIESLRAELNAEGGDRPAHACNVADERSVALLAETVQREVGALDVLMNNAGVAFLGGFEGERDSERRRILEDELRKEETRLAELKAVYKDGEPDRLGDERNYQKYLDRVQRLKDDIGRSEGNIASIRRELGAIRD